MISRVRRHLRPLAVRIGNRVFGTLPGVHTIPFGPLRNKKIYMSFSNGPMMWFGLTEARLFSIAKTLIKQGDIVYDIGAHIGYTAIFFSDLVKPDGEVHAFELLPTTANAYLRVTLEANKINNVVVHNVGLADQPADLTLPVDKRIMSNIFRDGAMYPDEMQERARVDTLDRYLESMQLPAPDLLKVDVESAEIKFLLGAEKTIKRYRPLMLIEFHSLPLLRAGYELLDDWGYWCKDEHGRELTAELLGRLEGKAFTRETYVVQSKS